MRRLVVVPDSDRVEQWLFDESLRADFVDLRGVCTLSQLVERCEPGRATGRAPADPLVVRLAFGALAPRCASAAFGASASSAEFAAQAQELINHLRGQAVTPRQLEAAAAKVEGSLAERVRALATLWRDVDAFLDERRVVDRADWWRLAAERVAAQGVPPSLRGFDVIELRHVHDVPPARLLLLEALARACSEAGVQFAWHWPSSGSANTDAFVVNTVREVEAKWQALDVEVLADVPEGPLSWVGREAFAEDVRPQEAPALSAFCAPSTREEAREIARRVRRLVSAGVPPETIGIAFRDLAEDSELLVEALADVGIPARARLGVPLAQSPQGRLALSVLHLADDGFPVEDVAALLESRAVKVLPPEAAAPRRTFREAGVRDDVMGAEKGRRLSPAGLSSTSSDRTGPGLSSRSSDGTGPGVSSTSSDRTGRGVTSTSVDRAGPGLSEPVEDRSERGAYAVRLEALASRGRDAARAVRLLAQTVQRVVDWCRAIPAQAPALELLDAWWDAVSKLGLLEPPAESRLPPLSSTMSAEVDRALARDQAAIEALGALLGELKEALTRSGLGRRSMSRREFSRWVRLAAADANLVARGPRVGAVWLLDAREVAGRRFAQLFLGGLLDGRFPGRPAPLALLGEEERAVLNRAAQRALFRMSVGEGDVRLGVRLAEDRLLFHLALSSAASVTVSRARVDDAGRELLASPFRDALLRCVTGFREEHLHRSAVPSLDEVQHDAELRVRAALEVHSPAATRQTPQDPRRAALAALLEDEPWFRAAADKGRIEAERLRFFTDPSMAAGPYTGRVEGEVLEALRGRLTFDAAHPVAAHELSQWGSCAFKGLATMVLGLEAGDEAGEELDARARGTFWHDALAKVVPALSAAGLLGKDDPETRAHLEAVIPEVAAEVAKRSSTGHPALWSLAQEWARTVLGRLVAAPEAALPFEGARPKFVEVSFGAKDSPDALREVRLPAARPGEQDVFCTGRMDRVDVGPGAVGVIDYKTSVSGSLKSDFLVREFQMALYVLAAKALAPDATANGAWVGIGRSELKTLSSVMGQAPLDALVATDAEARAKAEHEATPNLANAVHGLLGRLRAGDFGARPLDCDFCDLKPVCRISQRQLSEDAS